MWAIARDNLVNWFWEWLTRYRRPVGDAFLVEIEQKLAPKLDWRRL